MTPDRWQFIAIVAGTVSTLVGGPLTAILFYLRAIREDQRARQEFLDERMDAIAADVRQVETAVDYIGKNYTTKEEWTRETMLARQQLVRLTELMAKIEVELEQSHGLATQFLRATNAIIELTDRLSARLRD